MVLFGVACISGLEAIAIAIGVDVHSESVCSQGVGSVE